MKLYISNAFSLSMLDRDAQTGVPRPTGNIRVRTPRPASPRSVISDFMFADAEIISAIGHADTAAMLSEILDMELPVNRVSVKLTDEDSLLVGQYIGPRLPEGATTLPESATIEWWIV